MSNVIVKRQHQSAPGETPLDSAVKKAAEEIDGGRWIDPDPTAEQAALEGLGLALSMGTVEEVKRATSREGVTDRFIHDVDMTRDLNQLGRHPRVLEAIAALKAEQGPGYSGNRTPEEQLEREWMLYEMTCLQVQGQMWEGQQRWEGKENEEMRLGRLLTPAQFCEGLEAVVGLERFIRGKEVVKENPQTDKSGLIGLYVKNPLWDGKAAKREYKRDRAANLLQQAKKKTVKAERYFNAGMMQEATKLRGEVVELSTAAAHLQTECTMEEWREPELLRVASLQWPLMTEWMVMHFNEFGVPTAAKYKGWRTALLTMIRSRTITEQEAHKAFPVGSGPAAAWYLEQLYRVRNPVGGMAETVQ